MTIRKQVVRATTGDRGPPDGGVVIHTVEQLGPNMSLLPNGSLLCRNVPLARTGWMMYGPGETPIRVGKGSDVAYVERTDKDLFADDCLSSFVGAPIVDEHPDDDVTPMNWKALAKGTVLTARRGTGDESDLVIGDVLVNDASLIRDIRAGKREVSAGYDADYEQVSDGIGRQSNIIVNHIALVERGRCGPRCAIGDREYQPPVKKGQPTMATKRVQIKTGGARRVTLDTLRQRVADAEEQLAAAEEAEEVNSEGDGNATHIHIHTGGGEKDGPASSNGMGGADTEDDGEAGGEDPVMARITAIEASIEKLTQTVATLAGGNTGDDGAGDPEDDLDGGDVASAKPAQVTDDAEEDMDDESTDDSGFPPKEDEDEGKTKAKTGDSAALERSYVALLAKAEVLVPGFRVPTFDSKAKRKATVDAMCGIRRKVIDAAYMTKDGAALVNGITGRSSLNLAKMGCADVAVLFNAASAAKALINNAAAGGSGKTHDSAAAGAPKVLTIADINKQNAEFWAKQQAKR